MVDKMATCVGEIGGSACSRSGRVIRAAASGDRQLVMRLGRVVMVISGEVAISLGDLADDSWAPNEAVRPATESSWCGIPVPGRLARRRREN
jgi:hypothetical protein